MKEVRDSNPRAPTGDTQIPVAAQADPAVDGAAKDEMSGRGRLAPAPAAKGAEFQGEQV